MIKRFPWIKQHDSMQCGIACLAMICKFYGRDFSLNKLDKLCCTSFDGVSVYGLTMTAQALGLDTTCKIIDIDELYTLQCPCILHWNQTHFIVLYKISQSKHKFYVADPGFGLLKYTIDEFEKIWLNKQFKNKGIAIFLKPTDRFCKIELDSEEKQCFLERIYTYLIKYKQYLCQIGLGLIFGSLLQLILPFLMQMIVDIGIKQRDIGFIWLVLLGEFMIVTGRTATDFIRSWLLLHISMRINISRATASKFKVFHKLDKVIIR